MNVRSALWHFVSVQVSMTRERIYSRKDLLEAFQAFEGSGPPTGKLHAGVLLQAVTEYGPGDERMSTEEANDLIR